jgi:hypothetical protein
MKSRNTGPACECGRPKEPRAEACPRCTRMDAEFYHHAKSMRTTGVRRRREFYHDADKAFNQFLKSRGVT